MDPNKFRESRQAINRMCEHINGLIEKKAVDESRACFKEVNVELDALRPQAEGEIQERSVKNLGMKLNILAGKIAKLKEKKASRQNTSGGKQNIQWDEARIAALAPAFLTKLVANMADDKDSRVFFGTTGKGIRPNYRIEFGDGSVVGFTGSGHKPQDSLPAAGAGKLSEPFPFDVIQAALLSK
ncbi:MAG: hypothetical protein CSA29_04870 [Desulfobacterales bacterium]|nr:MAG: hypothetical protein CSA29_04870 [Desulfobacterales bacterium]